MTRRDVNSCCSNAKSNRAFKTVAATVKSSLTRLRSKSLHSIGVWEFNGGMKVKILTCAVVVGCMLGGIAFGQTLTITGTICSCDSKQLTVQEGTHYYIVKRTPSTSVEGTCSPGSTATVQCKSPDAQRKEGPCRGGTSPTPASGAR